MHLPAEYKTERLIMRKPVIADARKIFAAYGQDVGVCRYMTWKPHEKVDTLETWIEGLIAAFGKDNHSYVMCPVDDPETVIGMVDAGIESHRAVIGYVLSKEYWGNGLMTEAVSALVEILLSQEEIFRVSAVCDVENVASSRVMEKSGMCYEGILKRYIMHPNVSSEPRDVFCYAKTR